MTFSAVVKSCRPFDYKDKNGNKKSAFNVDVVFNTYEVFSIFSTVPYDEGESIVVLLSPGQFHKPMFSLSRPIDYNPYV